MSDSEDTGASMSEWWRSWLPGDLSVLRCPTALLLTGGVVLFCIVAYVMTRPYLYSHLFYDYTGQCVRPHARSLFFAV